MPASDKTLLEGWKAIAGYLGRPKRTVQRWERNKGLPVHRHEALGVVAYPSELDAWVKHPRQTGAAVPEIPIAGSVKEPGGNGQTDRIFAAGSQLRRYLRVSAWVALGVLVAGAVLANSYGLAILMLWVGAVLGVVRLRNTPFQWALVAIYLIAAMAYTCTASTMPEFQAMVINSTNLAPSPDFLFVLGIKYIPLFVLVIGYSVASVYTRITPGWSKAYTILGPVFLAVDFVFLGFTSGDSRVWKAGIPGRWTLLVASFVVFTLNIGIWRVARRYFHAESLSAPRSVFILCGIAYVGVAVAAFFADHEHNLINRYYLDIRWPDAYVVTNPDAVRSFQGSWPRNLKGKIGPDLMALLNDPSFIKALHHDKFYKQHSDEPFQLINRAVIYAYRPTSVAGSSSSAFVTIRFPQELAQALRFQAVGHR